MSDDKLAAALAEIRERSERPVPNVSALPISNAAVRGFMESAGDVPRLLAALDAILARHKPGRYALLGALCAEHDAYRMFSITSDEADRVASCPRCSATVVRGCDGCLGQWPCPDARAISAALLGGLEQRDALVTREEAGG